MKNIKFLEVGMENYGPYIDPMIIQFKSDTLTLITGPNGIGKTMAIDAIPFTLYGSTSKGAKGDDVVNNRKGKNCKTWVKFQVNDDNYTVIRYHKYTKFGNTVVVNHNGVDVKQGQREVLPYIERLVCPHQAFMNTLMFGQKVKDFFTDLVDSKRKEIFRKILDLGMFLVYYKFADQALKDVEAFRNELLNEIQISKGLIEDAISQINLLKKAKNDFYINLEKEIEEKTKELENTIRIMTKWEKTLQDLSSHDMDYESTITEIANLKKQLDSMDVDYKKKLDELTSQKSAKVSEMKEKSKDLELTIYNKYNDIITDLKNKSDERKTDLVTKVEKLNEEKHDLELSKNSHNHELKSSKERIDEIQSNVENIETGGTCPLCEQKIEEETVKVLEEKINKYKEICDNAQNQITNVDEQIKVITQELHTIRNQGQVEISKFESEQRATKRAMEDELEQLHKKLQDAIQKVDDVADKAVKEIINEKDSVSEDIINKLKDLQATREIQEENLKLKKEAEDTITKISFSKKQLEEEIAKLQHEEYDETQLKSYIAKEIKLKNKIKLSDEKLEKYDIYSEVVSFWKSGFSSTGIPSMLIDEAIPYMNERVEHYLDLLTNGRYVVSFDTLAETKGGEFRDKISVHVLDTETRANSRVQLSGGQTRIIDIAIILTLGDLLSRIQNVSFNIMLFDEVFDALDELNSQYVCKVLSKIKIGKALCVISHQFKDHLEADETLAFT
jgi:DNA repair exonuclease SbcCD ATPase subunit